MITAREAVRRGDDSHGDNRRQTVMTAGPRRSGQEAGLYSVIVKQDAPSAPWSDTLNDTAIG